MTDAGYVAGGYGVTVVAITAYIGHMWARNRTLARAASSRRGDSPIARADSSSPGEVR